MRELHSKVTTKGQVTIPIEVRRRLGLRPADKITFLVDDDQVRITRGTSVVARTAGAFKTDEPPVSAEDLRARAEEAIVEEAAKRASR